MIVAATFAAIAGERVNNLKVLSDKTDDVTTAENILKSFVKPEMNDADRAKAIWTAAVKYRHQTTPPNEFLADDWEAHDPVKIFNVYGYCMCCCTSSLIASLNRLDGREARGRILNGHSVPEVRDADGWHMYDCSLVNYFPKADGKVASVDEISEAVRGWLDKKPDLRKAEKLNDFMRADGWTGYKKGPELLANNPYYSLGWWPARTHGWNATMQEYDRKSEVYEYGYQIGHRALFSLRPGESFTREAGNRGLHVNGDKDWDGLKARTPDGDLVWMKQFFPAFNGAIVGNGVHRYAPNLASSGLADGADVYENLAEEKTSPRLHPKVGGKPGIAIVQLSSPYVYLDGRVVLKAHRKSDTDKVTVSISTNNGRTFAPLWTAGKLGVSETTIELTDKILRRYAYWLKIELISTSPSGSGLDSLVIENDFQHSPRTLPLLAKGENKITVAADADPAIATRTISCRITPDTGFKNNETSAAMGVTFDNLDVRDGSCWWKGGVGTMTVPVETAGDLVALRFGAQIRARGEKDAVKMLLSFDDGESWEEAARISGPTPGTTQYFHFDKIPTRTDAGRGGTRRALLRYEMANGNNTIGIFNFRVDADYRDPLAARDFRPFHVTHRWKENGAEKTFTQKVEKLPLTYSITAAAEPEMMSVIYGMLRGEP